MGNGLFDEAIVYDVANNDFRKGLYKELIYQRTGIETRADQRNFFNRHFDTLDKVLLKVHAKRWPYPDSREIDPDSSISTK